MPSTVIRQFTYDPGGRVLTITFVSGEVYDYLGVPAEVHAGLQAAASRGRFFGARIRNRYRFIRRGRGSGPSPEPPAQPHPAVPRDPASPNTPLAAYADPPAEVRRRTRAVGRLLPPRVDPRV